MEQHLLLVRDEMNWEGPSLYTNGPLKLALLISRVIYDDTINVVTDHTGCRWGRVMAIGCLWRLVHVRAVIVPVDLGVVHLQLQR